MRRIPSSHTRTSRTFHRRSQRLTLDQLEARCLLAGTWTPLANLVPDSAAQSMMLLPDGGVMVQGGGGFASKNWYRLTADSTGSFVNGTFSSLASMSLERLYFPSNILPSGKVFLLGGEYTGPATTPTWTNTGELYDPVANSWTALPNFPEPSFGDVPTVVLPSGKVLAGSLSTAQTYLYDPATNAWSSAATKLRSDRSDEESWALLPDGSVLSYDIFSSISTGVQTAQRYIPSANTWVDAGIVPVSLSSAGVGFELGPTFLLPDGRVFQIGANSNTALYTPSTNTWEAGPTIPNSKGSDDAPGAVLPNGHVIFASDTPLFQAPTKIFDFDPVANTITDVTPTGTLGTVLAGRPSFLERMLVLPNGDVLLSDAARQLWEYTPDGAPNDAWRPTISSIAPNGSATFTLTGTQLTGITEGASYGDDAEMATNYPIVQLTDSASHIRYARTFNWTPGVATGSAQATTQFKLPTGLPEGTYSVRVIASGIASAPVPLDFVTGPSVISSSPASGEVMGTPPTSFAVDFDKAILPDSLQAADLTVNGLAASNVTLDGTNKTATFTFDSSPVTAQGVQNMAIAFGAITGVDNAGVEPFAASFRYDALTLAVAATTPPVNGVFTIPATSFAYDVTFNETIDPTTAGVGNLTLTQGTVTAATVLPGNTTVRYTITGLATEGVLGIGLSANKIKDQFGNPGFAPFSATYQVDASTTSFPTPLVAVAPLGSSIYDLSTPGVINFAGDTDTFTLDIDAGQTVTVQVRPTSAGLVPALQLLDPSGALLASAVAAGPGQVALLQTIPTTVGGTYRVVVASGSSTVGIYSLRATLNAAVETEGTSATATNDTPATAESLNPTLLTVRTDMATAQHGAVLGTTDSLGSSDYYAFSATAGQTATMAATALATGTVTLDLVAQDGTTVLASGGLGGTNLSRAINNFTFATAGTYYLRVAGDPAVNTTLPYSLVVARSSAFDIEPNDTLASAQDVTGTQGALGAIVPPNSYQATVLAPGFTDISATGTTIAALNQADDSTALVNIGFTFNFFGTNYSSMFVSSNGLITFGVADPAFSNGSLSTNPAEAAIAPFWDDLIIANSAGNAAVKTQLVGAPGSRQLIVQWDKVSFFSGGSPGDTLTFQAVLSEGTNAVRFNYPDLVSGLAFGNNGASATVGVKAANPTQGQFVTLAANDGPNAFVGTGKSVQLVKFTGEDWYKVTLAPGNAALQVETSTPADGSGEFVNTLDPHLQLFDAANNLIATGTAQADGRNEMLRGAGLTPGATYYIRVTQENNTRGEYFLGVTPLRTPTITSLVDDDQGNGGFKAPNSAGKGWTSVQDATAFLGDYTIHSRDASPSKSNFAEWKIVATSANPELFATWVDLPGNATNATYQIFQDLPNKLTGVDDTKLLMTVVVDQTRSPHDALLFGTTLAESLGSVSLTGWVPGTLLSVRLLTLGANGNVVADGVFDPPAGQVAHLVSAGSGTAMPVEMRPSLPRMAAGFDSALAEAIAAGLVVKPSPGLVDAIDALAVDINTRQPRSRSSVSPTA